MRSTVTAISLPMASVTPVANDCTGVRLSARDGSVIHARTLEFGIDIQSNVLIVPRGFARTASAPDGKPGMQWACNYAVVGANGAGVPFIFDGHNEKGLAVGTFYFPGTPPVHAIHRGGCRALSGVLGVGQLVAGKLCQRRRGQGRYR